MKGGNNKYADIMHIGVNGTDIICSLANTNRTSSNMATDAGIGDHDIWRYLDHQKHLQT